MLWQHSRPNIQSLKGEKFALGCSYYYIAQVKHKPLRGLCRQLYSIDWNRRTPVPLDTHVTNDGKTKVETPPALDELCETEQFIHSKVFCLASFNSDSLPIFSHVGWKPDDARLGKCCHLVIAALFLQQRCHFTQTNTQHKTRGKSSVWNWIML